MQTMATNEAGSSHEQSGWCFVEESTFSVICEPAEDKSSGLNYEEYMLAMVMNKNEKICPRRPGMET